MATSRGATGAKKRAMQVNVVVRVRPTLAHEKQQPAALGVAKQGRQSVLTMSSPHDAADASSFVFDKCYDESTPQRLLFQREIQPAIAKVLDGINTTVFAYGATGTGKTFTMEGNKRNLGMIPRAVKRLFDVAEEQQRSFQIDMSYLEIYNDRVLDLLVPKAQQSDLPIRQQPDGTIAVQGLTRSRIASLSEFDELYGRGSANRARAPTDLNPESSRSHSILMIQARTSDAKGGEIRFGKLHLIDLAGSEDNRRTGNSGARLAESGKINMSLFVLGKVITALNSGDLQRIPFRDSKLTRMLQDSLGGSSHAVMICNVAKSAGMYQECLHTLHYASKAKGIVNQVVVNPTSVPTKKATKTKTDEKMTVSTASKAKTAAVLTKPAVKTTGSTAAPRLHKPTSATAAVTPRAPVAARKSSSPSPPSASRGCVDKMESKLSAWRMAKQEGRNSLEKRNSADGPTPSLGIKRAAPTSSSSATVPSLSSTRKPLARMSIATSALRVPMTEIGTSRVSAPAPAVKKPRLSLMPLSTNTSLINSSHVRKPPSALPAKRPPPGINNKPSDNKENVSGNIKPSALGATANIVKDLSPVDLAKKLIGVAIDLEKKQQYTAAYSVFKRAYHVLPEENPKLVERLNALEGECPTAPSAVPSQQMSTAVYMQLVLEMNLLEVLNTGSQEELMELHSIGDKRAEKILEARPFAQLKDLLNVQGITEKVLQKLHDHHIQW